MCRVKSPEYPDELEVHNFGGCAPLGGKPKHWLIKFDQSTSFRIMEKEFYDMPMMVRLSPVASYH